MCGYLSHKFERALREHFLHTVLYTHTHTHTQTHTHTHTHTHRAPGSSEGKASACNAGDPGSIPGLRRSPGEGNGNPL